MSAASKASSHLLFAETSSSIEVRPAASMEELEQAFHLVYKSYLARHYITPNKAETRLSLFNAVPQAMTFVGAYEDSVVATVSLIPDTPAGLPMEAIYHPELQQLRDQNCTVSEVTMLADRRVEIRRTLPMLLALMKLVFDYAVLMLRATDICITINPRHSDFYSRYLLFTELAGVRSYPSVRNNPAVARRLDLTTIRERCQEHDILLRIFFQERTPAEIFEHACRITPEHLASLAQRTDIVAEAPQALYEYVCASYSDLPWHKWPRQGPGQQAAE